MTSKTMSDLRTAEIDEAYNRKQMEYYKEKIKILKAKLKEEAVEIISR